jgi:hypothetical protein
MAIELSNMKTEQARFAKVVKDAAVKAAEKQKVEKVAIEARIKQIKI